jgi:hypothetical protein
MARSLISKKILYQMEKIIEFTPDQLNRYIRENIRHKAYADMVKQMNRIKVHADGTMPTELIRKQRPSESEKNQKYREDIYEPETESPVSRVFNNLEKIRKSPDWKIKFDQNKIPKQITEEQSLEDYITEYFPFFGSIEKWAFDVALRENLIDANAVVVITPISFAIAENEYLQPFPSIYNSDMVLDFVPDNYAVVKSSDQATYIEGAVTYNDGEVYLVITSFKIQRWEQTKSNKTFTCVIDYDHNLGFMPAFRMGGLYKTSMDQLMIYKSRIDSMVPHLNKAARESNDLDAGVVQHMHLESWQYAAQDCTECQGTGKLMVNGEFSDKNANCKKCAGTGKIIGTSPFGTFMISPQMAGENPQPVPPKGYIDKDVSIITIQDKRIGDHIYKALSAINMNFLADMPLNQSGKAKEVDQDALNTFVNSIAEDLVSILKKIIYIINEYRYSVIIPDKMKRIEMLPSITVPEKFDLLSSDYMIQDLEKSRNVNISPILINEMTMGFAVKKFKDQPDILDKLQLILALDPFPGMNQDDKVTAMQNGGIMKEDYIISNNIYQFILRALEEFEAENKDFMSESIVSQRKIIFGYAQKMANDMSAKDRILNPAPVPGGEPCPTCGGKGQMMINGKMQDCPDCAGTGKMPPKMA